MPRDYPHLRLDLEEGLKLIPEFVNSEDVQDVQSGSGILPLAQND
jgi:hypothetical protein